MADGKPWEKYAQNAGPWTKYQSATPPPIAPQSSPIQDKTADKGWQSATGIGPHKPATPRPTASLSTGETIKRYSGLEGFQNLEDKAMNVLPDSVKELLFGGQSAGKPMGTSSGVLNNPVTQAMAMAPEVAGMGAAAEKGMSKVEPLARLNKILGVGPKEVRLGTTPTSLDEFAANPARGVLKSGLKEKDLAKMNPLERTQSLTQVRNEAGRKLDQVLQANPDKTINVQKSIEDTFKQIPDRRLQKLATQRLQMILQKANITKPLSQLTPMEARTVQRGLDEFANFAPEGTAKSFSDIATALRRGISKATRQAIPETAELDQDYGDLAGAVKAVRRQANKYARTVPESRLRKIAPYLAGAAGGTAAAAGAKYLLPSTTP